MRLIPRFAKVGPWYAVVPYRALLAVALLAAVFWPYLLVPDVPVHFGPLVSPILVGAVLFLVQRRQVEERSGLSFERCLQVLARVRREEPVDDPAELAAVREAVRPHLRTAGLRWILAAGPILVAAIVFATHARHLTGWTIFATAYAFAAAAVLFVLSTRRQRRDRELLARLDGAYAG